MLIGRFFDVLLFRVLNHHVEIMYVGRFLDVLPTWIGRFLGVFWAFVCVLGGVAGNVCWTLHRAFFGRFLGVFRGFSWAALGVGWGCGGHGPGGGARGRWHSGGRWPLVSPHGSPWGSMGLSGALWDSAPSQGVFSGLS